MRKTWIILPLALMALILAPILAYTHSPAESAPTAIILPTATPTYPACITEDGAGQALCWWDAQRQGNGEGTSVLSGDCAPSVMGEASHVCVNLHARDSITITNEDGSMNTIPNGADLVAECTDEFDKGMERQECIKAWHNS